MPGNPLKIWTGATTSAPSYSRRLTGVFLVFLRLGCTSFGGPIAHLGYFQREFVENKRWLSFDAFTELVALAQTLPGPSSSQVGYSIGLLRAGLPGGVAAWLGFTLPSALLMLAFAFGHSLFADKVGLGVVHGLQLAAVAVVAQAVLAMQRNLAPDRGRFAIAFLAAALVLLIPMAAATILAISFGAGAGLLLQSRPESKETAERLPTAVSTPIGVLALLLFGICLVGSFIPSKTTLTSLSLLGGFLRAGSLVFGGGHVVLPLLEEVTVRPGWLSQERFIAGYGAAQALPGPLFAYSAYLGAAVQPARHQILNSLLAILGIFLPGLLLITGVLPFYQSLIGRYQFRKALQGINAAVVGVLIATLYNPLWTSSIHSSFDFLLALGAFVALVSWRIQPWIVVMLAGVCGGFR